MPWHLFSIQESLDFGNEELESHQENIAAHQSNVVSRFLVWGEECLVIWSLLVELAGKLKARRLKEIFVFTYEFHCPTNFLPGDEIIGDSFQSFLFEVWRWLPHMPRHCEGTLRGIVKCRASSTTTALIAVREVKLSR
ncbi:hypothetical protein AVEN_141592-1 [Araneus ventricosus]|uniref:Uncharacterized protein n=1 Tax=Araneus ventricosus TaxID=182803 RepID=A0A4Y2RAI4_ARAVE|nr:hypothetical protein AVEN_141592-1 [Araneus ventricosus]